MATINLRIPDDLHKAFRLMCVTEDISMNKKIVQLIYNHVHSDEVAKAAAKRIGAVLEQTKREIEKKRIEKEQGGKQ